jgi:hypothetical protein
VSEDEHPREVLGALPHTRPHRRSAKRKPPAGQATAAAKPKTASTAKPKPKPPTAAAKATPAGSSKRKPTAAKPKPTAAKPKPAARLRQPAQPAGTPARGPASARPPARRSGAQPRRATPPSGGEILSTAVQAAAELAEIGLTAGARALRNALSRLPRP